MVQVLHTFILRETYIAGAYALIGARIVTPYPHSKGLATIVDMGYDFPPSIRDELEALQCSIVLRETPERKTTMGLNTYGPGEFRGIQHLSTICTDRQRVPLRDSEAET